ncbi:lauroyl/myristoyl acyltransferase [Novosphingobium chloroacetimidivorans]|uniref:Lauroyl/myristoyl acyltransferase n=1 Tax=Novosphingobium chloroacetimidivorans TaxID=1428314 RepID=A0A7W7K6A6_9SPHN|nr:hypothetical protein [Novosphingobium chloroacetimidivorans]MBB4857022.1 lauroyl/myristoyl acyltransferase [Novosphingobium chloroacetimidivorans]
MIALTLIISAFKIVLLLLAGGLALGVASIFLVILPAIIIEHVLHRLGGLARKLKSRVRTSLAKVRAGNLAA